MVVLLLSLLFCKPDNRATNQLLAATVRVFNDDLETQGTGLLVQYNGSVYMVIPKHLIGIYSMLLPKMGTLSKSLEMHIFLNLRPLHFEKTVISIDIAENALIHPNKYIDLAVLDLRSVQAIYPELINNAVSFSKFASYSNVKNKYDYDQGDRVEILGFPGLFQPRPIPTPVFSYIGSNTGILQPVPVDKNQFYTGKFFILTEGAYPGHSGSPILIYPLANQDLTSPREELIIGILYGGLPNSPYGFVLSVDYIVEIFTYSIGSR